MTCMRKISCLVLLCLMTIAAIAQTGGCNSSYSRFGLGLLSEQSDGLRKSMGGAGLGLRVGNRINSSNPASLSAIDSLSFLMDVGMKSSFGKMQQGNQTVAVNNSTLDYVHVGLRLRKGLGLAIGFTPYTNIGYDYDSPDLDVATETNSSQTISSSNGYAGSGGLNRVYMGVGWRVWRNLSVGVNGSFVWGDYYHVVGTEYKEAGVSSDSYSCLQKIFSSDIRTYRIDFGAQYVIRLDADDLLTVGATYGLGHKIRQDAELLHLTTDADTTFYTAHSPFDLPHGGGLGVAWQHKANLLVALDANYEAWGACRMPVEVTEGYEARTGQYRDLYKVAAGAQWTPDPVKKDYWKRVQYRAGMSWTSPYVKINGMDGPYELSLRLGMGLPITNRINSRSVVNIGAEWLRRNASGSSMVKEDYFLINLGLTFNEAWFMKYKIK